MVAEFPWYNVTIIIVIVTLLLYQLTRFSKSEKPHFFEPENRMIRREVGRNSLGEPTYSEERQYSDEEFENVRKKTKAKYNRKRAIYYTTYLLPVILALLSFIAVINFNIGVPLLISAIVSTVISEVAIKIWNIGIKQVQGY
ncbi:MAG: hypothetical protein KAS76_02655 [Thermoplasmatales archaeon]|nr:hypothetical protein [Thermoplasmatales archaeon]